MKEKTRLEEVQDGMFAVEKGASIETCEAILKDIEGIRSMPVYRFIQNPEVNAMINSFQVEIQNIIKRGLK